MKPELLTIINTYAYAKTCLHEAGDNLIKRRKNKSLFVRFALETFLCAGRMEQEKFEELEAYYEKNFDPSKLDNLRTVRSALLKPFIEFYETDTLHELERTAS